MSYKEQLLDAITSVINTCSYRAVVEIARTAKAVIREDLTYAYGHMDTIDDQHLETIKAANESMGNVAVSIDEITHWLTLDAIEKGAGSAPQPSTSDNTPSSSSDDEEEEGFRW